MMRWRIYREQFERSAGARHKVVLRARGYDDDISGGNRPPLVRKYCFPVALDEGQDLIGPRMDFLSDLAAGRHAHENELGTFGCVQHPPEIGVAACELLYVGRVWLVRYFCLHPVNATLLL
jgi:hypothetical protein